MKAALNDIMDLRKINYNSTAMMVSGYPMPPALSLRGSEARAVCRGRGNPRRCGVCAA
jgi:hypothetical protein